MGGRSQPLVSGRIESARLGRAGAWALGTERRASGPEEIRGALLAGPDLRQLGDNRGRAPRRTAGFKNSGTHARSLAGVFLAQGNRLSATTCTFPGKTVHRL